MTCESEVTIMRKVLLTISVYNLFLSLLSIVLGSHMQGFYKAQMLSLGSDYAIRMKGIWAWVSESLSIYFAIAFVAFLIVFFIVFMLQKKEN